MRRIVARGLALVSVVASVLVFTNPPTYAANADATDIVGAGIIQPGLTAVPGPQWFDFGGNAQVVGTHGINVSYVCGFAGNGLLDSYAEGTGTLGGYCGPINLNLCVYLRVVTQVHVMCAGSGTPKQFASGEFEFVPLVTLPLTTAVTAYELAGGALYADA